MANKPPPPDSIGLLTHRQSEVLQAMAHGLSNAEIAAMLQISVETVKSHSKAIFLKLQARDRTQAVLIGLRTALVQLNHEDDTDP